MGLPWEAALAVGISRFWLGPETTNQLAAEDGPTWAEPTRLLPGEIGGTQPWTQVWRVIIRATVVHALLVRSKGLKVVGWLSAVEWSEPA